MAEAEAGLKVGLRNADTDHIALAGVHNALDAVQEGVDLALHNGLEVGLHVLARDLDDVGQGDLGADGDLVELGAVDRDLVVLDLGGVSRGDQLEAVLAGAVDLDLHVALADDLAFERGSEGDRNVDRGDLDLDVARLEGGGVELADVLLHDEALRDAVDVLGLVRNDREAEGNGASAAGDDDVVQGLEGVDERGNALHRVLHQAACIARGDVAEDQGRAQRDGDDMDDGGDILAERDDADIVAGLVALLLELVDDAAHEGDEDALALVALHERDGLIGRGSGAEDNGNAGDVARDQRHAEVTNDGVGQVAVAGQLIGRGAVEILQDLDELGAQCGGHAGHEGVVQAGVAGHERLDDAESLLQLAEGADLRAGDGVVAGQGVGSVGEGHGLAFAVLGDGIVNGGLGQAVNGIVAAEYTFK